MTPAAPTVHHARFAELAPAVLYAILKLRSDVFVVEQQCACMDMDGRDTEPATVHLWVEDAGRGVVATARIVHEGGIAVIGRVVTRAGSRGAGLGAALLTKALRMAGRPVELKAQARLESWYAAFGFTRCSAEWIEDGIAHVQMRLER